jgi:hypothetical protein
MAYEYKQMFFLPKLCILSVKKGHFYQVMKLSACLYDLNGPIPPLDG